MLSFLIPDEIFLTNYATNHIFLTQKLPSCVRQATKPFNKLQGSSLYLCFRLKSLGGLRRIAAMA